METFNEVLRNYLLENIPLFSIVKQHQARGLVGPYLETPNGNAEYKQWKNTTEIAAHIVEDELTPALARSREQSMYTMARHIEIESLSSWHDIKLRRRLPHTIRSNSHKFILLASPETWLWFHTQDIAVFRPNFLDDKFYFDGISCMRHDVDKDIFVDVKDSGIWNLETTLSVNYSVDNDSYQVKIKVSGWFLFNAYQHFSVSTEEGK